MKPLLAQLVTGRPLTADQAVEAFELIMTGQASPAQTAALLAMIQQRGPTVDEITGAARVMRSKVTPVAGPPGLTLIDTWAYGDGWLTCLQIDNGRIWQANQRGELRVSNLGRYLQRD